jgi:hypothetical protein
MDKDKMPPQLLEHFKKTEAKNKDGSEMSDNEKRKAALEKARKYKKQKNKKTQNASSSPVQSSSQNSVPATQRREDKK